MDEFELNEHHASILEEYAAFCRYQRQIYLKSMGASFRDSLNSDKLLEETYTKEELLDMFGNAEEMVRSDLETELLNFSHVNALMLCQLFAQAEKWHLQLRLNLSEMQNKDLLERMKNFEGMPGKVRQLGAKLTPLSTDIEKTSQFMRSEISNLTRNREVIAKEAEQLRNKISTLESELAVLKMACEDKDKTIDTLNAERKNESRVESTEATQQILEDYDSILKEQIEMELQGMRREVEGVRSQLTLAEMELEKKFGQTAVYANMKKMLTKKNDQIKDLRLKLAKYERVEHNEEIRG